MKTFALTLLSLLLLTHPRVARADLDPPRQIPPLTLTPPAFELPNESQRHEEAVSSVIAGVVDFGLRAGEGGLTAALFESQSSGALAIPLLLATPLLNALVATLIGSGSVYRHPFGAQLGWQYVSGLLVGAFSFLVCSSSLSSFGFPLETFLVSYLVPSALASVGTGVLHETEKRIVARPSDFLPSVPQGPAVPTAAPAGWTVRF
jgi:hypothetical protein